MITVEMSPKDYWLSFNQTWIELGDIADLVHDEAMVAFFDELADDAADVWAGLLGPLSDGKS